MGKARQHEVREHFDVVMVPEAALHVLQEDVDIDTVQAGLQEGVHALERGLADVQPVIHRVFEGAHLHLSDKLFLWGGKCV